MPSRTVFALFVSGLCVSLAALAPGVGRSAVAPPALYTAIDLNTYGLSAAGGLNLSGEISGISSGNAQHAVLWKLGAVTDLGTLQGGTSSAAGTGLGSNSINDLGQVVGQSQDGSGNTPVVLWTPDHPRGTTGKLVSVGTLPGGIDAAGDNINNSGAVAGYSDQDVNGPTGGDDHAMAWLPNTPNSSIGTMHDLSFFQQGEGQANGINDQGTVTGSVDAHNAAGYRGVRQDPFRWSPGMTVPEDMGLPEDFTSGAGSGINRAGDIVGYVKKTGLTRAFLVPAGGTLSTANLLPGANTQAFCLNNHGEIVGLQGSTGTGGADPPWAIFWNSSGMVDLNTVVRVAPGILSAGLVVNDAGQILARGYVQSGDRQFTHYYLLTPTDTGSLRVSATALDFGTVKKGRGKARTIKVMNAGSQPLSISAGPADGPFKMTPATTTFTLAPRAIRTLRLQFAPAQAGSYGETLTLTSNTVSALSVNVVLRGKATP